MSATPLINNHHVEIDQLHERYQATRDISVALTENLSAEDACVQSMPDCSPTKWHLAHTSWFFETFLLEEQAHYRCFHPQFKVLFNSYYNTVGEQHPRPQRGMLSRPSLDEVLSYRRHVDEYMQNLFSNAIDKRLEGITEVGIQHEQQHQELLLMDLKHLLAQNPLKPCYKESPKALDSSPAPIEWLPISGGVVEIGAAEIGFSFDNETPRHQHLLQPFQIANRLITNGEFLDFINDGSYQEPQWWLADGWHIVQQQGWNAPFYWRDSGEDGWLEFTLHGERELNLDEPVVHLSFYEADAFARWAGARLPSEMEWEYAANTLPATQPRTNADLTERTLHPLPVETTTSGRLNQLYSDLWQWTASAYLPYPGYTAPAGAIGEYNGKFMSNQMVLKGASCVTPKAHSRASYRNFFYPHCRWQFAGLRLAR